MARAVPSVTLRAMRRMLAAINAGPGFGAAHAVDHGGDDDRLVLQWAKRKPRSIVCRATTSNS